MHENLNLFFFSLIKEVSNYVVAGLFLELSTKGEKHRRRTGFIPDRTSD